MIVLPTWGRTMPVGSVRGGRYAWAHDQVANVEVYHQLLAQSESQTKLFRASIIIAGISLVVAGASLIVALVALTT